MIVTFEQAKKLKKLKYNGECLYWYNQNGTKECPIEQGYMEYYYEVDCFLNDWNAEKIYKDLYGSYPPEVSYSVPTVSEALQWIRENKQIECGAYPDNGFYYCIQYIPHKNVFGGYKSYPEAESALLDSILNYLIEKS